MMTILPSTQGRNGGFENIVFIKTVSESEKKYTQKENYNLLLHPLKIIS